MLLFSSAPAGIRAVHLDALALGVCRLTIASLGMTLLLALRWQQTKKDLQQWNWRTTRALLFLGLAFGIHWLFFFLSIKIGSAAIGTIGFSTYGLHLIVLGWLLGRGTITRIDLLGLLLACLGTWFLLPEFSLENKNTLGLMIGILGGLTAAALPLLNQHYADISSNLRAWGQFTFAIPVFLCCQPWARWELQTSDLPLILYLSIGIALVGHGLWVHATTALSTTTISILSYLYLPTSLILGYFTLGEKLAGRALLGTLLVFLANALVLVGQNRRAN